MSQDLLICLQWGRGLPSLSQPAPEVLVLLSGGLDSAALLSFFRMERVPVASMFIDYGQIAAIQELSAVKAVAQYFDVPLTTYEFKNAIPKAHGEIRSRNAAIIGFAAMEAAEEVWGIAIGIHSGTHYHDCSSEFVASMTAALSCQRRPCRLLAPFVEWNKAQLLQFCVDTGVPISLTYSCEVGHVPPCGRCLSCLDRKDLDATYNKQVEP